SPETGSTQTSAPSTAARSARTSSTMSSAKRQGVATMPAAAKASKRGARRLVIFSGADRAARSPRSTIATRPSPFGVMRRRRYAPHRGSAARYLGRRVVPMNGTLAHRHGPWTHEHHHHGPHRHALLMFRSNEAAEHEHDHGHTHGRVDPSIVRSREGVR